MLKEEVFQSIVLKQHGKSRTDCGSFHVASKETWVPDDASVRQRQQFDQL
jgi:hypothetical protein